MIQIFLGFILAVINTVIGKGCCRKVQIFGIYDSMEENTIQKNVLVVRCLFEKQASQDDTSLYDQLFSEEVQLYGPASGQVSKGLKALKKIDQGYHRAYPGAQFEIEKIFGYGDEVIVRWTCRATYKKGLKGITPKKKEFCIWGVSIYAFKKGKIQEIRQFWDRLGILEQIGEVRVRYDPVEPGYYKGLLKDLGLEEYAEKATLLSNREQECLEFLIQGKTAKETAARMKLSSRTVESYLINIKKKLGCSNKGQLFTIAQILKKLELF
jgi:DNA-binding CsgD family transcriptional regulator/predicted ester cyclase